MKDRLRIRIRPDWDAVLTYDVLNFDHSAVESEPIFVGRDALIGPLVTEIAGVENRGTYLVSGYRGSGKTTLLIAALLRAKRVLKQRHQTLFPLVLNVSEISASLTTPVPAAPGAGATLANTGSNLQVDPRRLLTALLRAVNQRLTLVPPKANCEQLKDLAERAAFAYRKATASKFTQAASQAEESVRSAKSTLTFAVDDKNVLKTIAWAAASAAIALESVAWFGPIVGWLHTGALALAGMAALSVSASFKVEQSQKRTDARRLAIEHDNSLQQLETDLKDMLVDLKSAGLRTVVVMEELDKIEDESGAQLDSVIRYFKNLFTQSPALFFFVTDRRYFDIISSAIRQARRHRSYAIQHTFFTHRVFVGRPTTQECLQFIRAAVLEEEDRKAIDDAASTLGKPAATSLMFATPTLGTEATHPAPALTGAATPTAGPEQNILLGQWLRVVLFRAENHLFDLKNELRRYVEEQGEQRYFGVDGNKLPEQAAALAKFQELIEFKRVTYEIKGGRPYANEVLNDCLYAVFSELGASRTQNAEEYLPKTEADPVIAPTASQPQKVGDSLPPDDTRQTQVLLAEQLDPSEVDRIREAVMSLIGDLERGRAFASRLRTENTFIWRPDAAKAFSYVRQLEPHEETLLNELSRHAGLLAPLAEMKGLLTSVDEAQARQWINAIEQQTRDLREAKLEALSRDAATDQVRGLQTSYASWFSAIIDELIRNLSAAYPFFLLFPVSVGIGGGLQYVQPPSGDPRYLPTTPRGGVLLAYGQTDQLIEDFWSFVNPQTQPSIFPLERVSIVHIIHAVGNLADAEKECRERWMQSSKERSGSLPHIALAIDVVVLTAQETEPALQDRVSRIAAGVLSLGYWAHSASRIMAPYLPGNMPLMHDAQFQAIGKWFNTDKQILNLPGGDPPPRAFGERDHLESTLGAALIDVSMAIADVTFCEGMLNEVFRVWDPNNSFVKGLQPDVVVNWMFKTRRAVMFLSPQVDLSQELMAQVAGLLDAGARLILIGSGDSAAYPQIYSALKNVSTQNGYAL